MKRVWIYSKPDFYVGYVYSKTSNLIFI